MSFRLMDSAGVLSNLLSMYAECPVVITTTTKMVKKRSVMSWEIITASPGDLMKDGIAIPDVDEAYGQYSDCQRDG